MPGGKAKTVGVEGAGALGDQAWPPALAKIKFELQGFEHLEKMVTASHRCGRVYLPLGWVGKRVKIIRLD